MSRIEKIIQGLKFNLDFHFYPMGIVLIWLSGCKFFIDSLPAFDNVNYIFRGFIIFYCIMGLTAFMVYHFDSYLIRNKIRIKKR